MDPIVATFAIKVTIRAPEGTAVEAPTVAQLEAAVEAAVVENVSGNGVLVTANAIAERTDN